MDDVTRNKGQGRVCMKRNEEVYRRVPLATEGKIRPNNYHIRGQGIYTLARYRGKRGVTQQGIYTSDTIVSYVERGARQGLKT